MTHSLDFSLLPEDLRDLGPLITKYSEGDDAVRADVLANASDQELRDLSEAPAADWDSINSFLDEHVAADPGPYQDVALALDSFAQAALEARIELDGR